MNFGLALLEFSIAYVLVVIVFFWIASKILP